MAKKAIMIILTALIVICTAACGEAPARRAVDCRYTEQQRIVHEGQRQGINPRTGEMGWVTYTYEDVIPAKYELKWEVDWQPGGWVYEWRPCTQAEYEAFKEGRADDVFELPRIGD